MNSSQKIENNKMSCDTVPNNNSMDKLKEIDTNYKAESQVEAIKNEIDPEEQEIYSKYWNSYIATIMKSKTKIRGEKVLEIFQETNLNKKTMAKVKYPVNQIYLTCNPEKTKKLNFSNFLVGMQLLSLYQKQIEITTENINRHYPVLLPSVPRFSELKEKLDKHYNKKMNLISKN